MIEDGESLRRFEDRLAMHDHPSHSEALRLLDGMWQEGVKLGVLPPADPWDGLEADLAIARALRSCSRSS